MESTLDNQCLEHLTAVCQSFVSSALSKNGDSAVLMASGAEDNVNLLSEHLILLKRHSNTFRPILRLPVEVLILIFQFTIALAYKVQGRQNIWNTVMSPSQTCHIWRELALDLKYLWTDPICEFPSLATEMIRRAGQLSLSLTTHMIPSDQTFPVFWKRVVRPPMPGSETPRAIMIRHMNVAGQTSQLQQIFSRHFLPSLSHLESLEFHVHDILPRVARTPELQMSEMLTGLIAPRLRSLSLTNCITRLDNGLLKHLTLLELRLIEEQGIRKPTGDELLNILNKAQNLTTLKLDNIVSTQLPQQAHQRVLLRNLVHLDVRDTYVKVLHFRSFVHLPATATVNVHLSDRIPSRPSMRWLIEKTVPTQLQSQQLTDMHLVHISGTCCLDFQVLDNTPRIEGIYSFWTLQLKLRMTLLEVFRCITGDFPLKTVENVRMTCDYSCILPAIEEWKELLVRAPNVRRLDLTGNIALPLIVLLSKATHELASPVPYLRELTLRRVDLSTHYSEANDADGYPITLGKTADLVIVYLSAQYDAGDKLQRLVLDNCPGSDGLQNLLSSLVEEDVVCV